jgi:hypothetical protein
MTLRELLDLAKAGELEDKEGYAISLRAGIDPHIWITKKHLIELIAFGEKLADEEAKRLWMSYDEWKAKQPNPTNEQKTQE